MARIAYGLSGEGRGHATRVGTVVDKLRDEHQFLLLASGVAYDFLSNRYARQSNVQVCRIPGLEFQYQGQRLDYFKSVVRSLPFIMNLRKNVGEVAERLRRFEPDLAITDFEPLTPRAARQLGIPLVSFDHQHFLAVSRLSELPWQLRLKGWAIGLSVRLFCSGQQETIVSSFFTAPLRRGVRRVRQVGVLLRPEILRAQSVDHGHLLVYLRRFAKQNLIEALRTCGRTVRIYGVGLRPDDGNLSFHNIDDAAFVRDMASCHAVISNAGNQLVGESLYLRKPFLALPESGNVEQALNAHFLERSGGGIAYDYDSFTLEDLKEFLRQAPALGQRIRELPVAGNADAVAAICRNLEERQPRSDKSKAEPVAA